MNTDHPFLATLYGLAICLAVAALGFYPFRRLTPQRVDTTSRRDTGR